MSLPPKAESVNAQGEQDGFVPSLGFTGEVLQGGYTRLVVSSPPGHLELIHRLLVQCIEFPCKLRYVRMTDRQLGQLPSPESFVAVELTKERLFQALTEFRELFYHDGRNQIWILGAKGEQLILDEIGMVYLYPDDFLFRDVLNSCGAMETKAPTMANRDYVKVNFLSQSDAQEQRLFHSLGLVRWEG